MVQSLLAYQRLEEEQEDRHSTGGVPIPSDISTSSALVQAMLARQRAEDADPSDKPPSSALVQAMQARQAAQGQEKDDYHNTAGFSENPLNTPSAVTYALQARQRAEEDGEDYTHGPSSSESAGMMQIMQARQRAEELLQNPAPTGSSALIQAMLARQQAQNEYDDGYWTLS